MKLKVLLVSRNAWDNKTGNTLSNFFQDFESEQLAQIYCRDELPDNDMCKKYFCISEKKLIKSLITRKSAGNVITDYEISNNVELQKAAKAGNEFYNVFRHYRFTLLLWFRELIWFFGVWKSKELEDFIHDFNPDVIYTDSYDTFYTYRLLNYVKKISNAPYVMFHCDDQLTYKKFSFSPLFWINRFVLRQYVKQAIKGASINYCIIDEQLRVYNSIVPANYKILNKCAAFDIDFEVKKVNNPIRMVYAGNLHLGRWETLQKLAEAISEINKEGIKIQLDIYTGKSVSDKNLKKIQIDSAIQIHDFIPYNELILIQKCADILLHVESFHLKERLITFLSFSTKIVDFFEAGKCIIAIGWKESAPIKYLKEKDAAITITDKNKFFEICMLLIEKPEIINEYSQKAFNCGKIFHSKEQTLQMFNKDLLNIVTSKEIVL